MLYQMEKAGCKTDISIGSDIKIDLTNSNIVFKNKAIVHSGLYFALVQAGSLWSI